MAQAVSGAGIIAGIIYMVPPSHLMQHASTFGVDAKRKQSWPLDCLLWLTAAVKPHLQHTDMPWTQAWAQNDPETE